MFIIKYLGTHFHLMLVKTIAAEKAFIFES